MTDIQSAQSSQSSQSSQGTQTSVPSPYLFYDAFIRGDGALGSPWLADGSWSISGNKAINNPGLGVELVPDNTLDTGCFGGDPWGDWTCEDGWSIAGGIGSAVSSGGSQLQWEGILSANKWYQLKADLVSKTSDVICLMIGYSLSAPLGAPGSYVYTNCNSKRLGATGQFGGFYSDWFAGSVDNLYIKELTLHNLFSLVPFEFTNFSARAKLAEYKAHTQMGVILRADSQSNPLNYLLCYQASGYPNPQIELIECINGNYSERGSELLSVAHSYASGDSIEVTFNGNNIQVYSINSAGESTLIGTATTTISSGHYCGVFSTDIDNKFGNFMLF